MVVVSAGWVKCYRKQTWKLESEQTSYSWCRQIDAQGFVPSTSVVCHPQGKDCNGRSIARAAALAPDRVIFWFGEVLLPVAGMQTMKTLR